MVCPRCGLLLSSTAAACPRCAVLRGHTVATGVLTPPPVPDGDAVTGFPDSRPPYDPTDSPTSDVPDLDRTIGFGAASSGAPDAATSAFPAPVPARVSARGLPEPGQTFGSRYHIIRALGVGGMGAVYQAWDAELGIAVAIKVIRPDVMADPVAAAEVERRFKRELLLARQVTHKNVVRIHDLGEIDGVKYITMSYVEGSDLASILKRDGSLAVPDVLRIARAVVSGLVEAHKAGVVHRDLKPANIMIERNGDALIMDFGIARSSSAPPAAAAAAGAILPAGVRQTAVTADATRYGAVMGTVEYMAPEQFRGVDVDQRADIYALGLMLYDMLVGRERRPKTAPTPLDELRGRMEQAPAALKSLLPDIPDAVDRLVSRCLDPDPANRYQTTEALAADLDRLDADGIPIPEPRRFTPRMIAAGVVLVAALVTSTWWLTRTPPPPKKHDPITVVIADFQNATGDAMFDHTLEQTFRRGLEGAGFITAYDRTKIRSGLGVPAPEKLDEVAARQLAVKQGLGVVLSASIGGGSRGYEIAVKASQPMTGNVIVSATGRASNKDRVLEAATKLVATVRKALGDETTDSAQLLAMRTLSTTSLDVAASYAAAMEAQSQGKFDDALQNYGKAVERDPKFGLGYQGLSAMAQNLGRIQDSNKYAAEALKYLDGMTERERFTTRAVYFLRKDDYQQCAKEYGELIAKYPADAVAHNQRAICLARLRKMRDAVDEMRQAIQIAPKRLSYRVNLAIFQVYAGDFDSADKEIRAMPDGSPVAVPATLTLALSQLGRGLVRDAEQTYEKVRAMGSASSAAAGLGDLAIYEGRFSEAVRILDEGVQADLAAKTPDLAAQKLTELAYAQLARGQSKLAIAAAERALQISSIVPVRFLAGRILVEAGAVPKARTLAAALLAELPAAPQAYGKILEGEIALRSGDARSAIKLLTEANALVDTWLGRFDLGRAYLAGRAFAQADSEFDQCIARRGEALSLLDEDPTTAYFPSVYYYQGRVREGLQNAGFAASYREYLKIRGSATEDPLLPDVRRRAGT